MKKFLNTNFITDYGNIMVLDDEYTPIKLRNEVIAELDRIKDENPILRTRPDVIKHIITVYNERTNGNGLVSRKVT